MPLRKRGGGSWPLLHFQVPRRDPPVKRLFGTPREVCGGEAPGRTVFRIPTAPGASREPKCDPVVDRDGEANLHA